MTSPLRVVVADDEPDIREYFRRCLPRLGHELVAEAANGLDLVELCHACQPDLVITDIQMPELDGLDAARQLARERPVPVIVVTAHPDRASLAEDSALDAVHGFLAKPIKLADLAACIAQALGRFRHSRLQPRQFTALLPAKLDLVPEA